MYFIGGIIVGLLLSTLCLLTIIWLDYKLRGVGERIRKEVAPNKATILPSLKKEEGLDFIQEKNNQGEDVWLEEII